MLNVLTAAGSSHLPPFLALCGQIQEQAAVAADNARFLAILEAPCTALAGARLQDMPALLPRVLDCIRLLWTHSSGFGKPDRTAGLLRRLCRDVIDRCAATIRAAAPLSGNVEAASSALQQSIAAGVFWVWMCVWGGSTCRVQLNCISLICVGAMGPVQGAIENASSPSGDRKTATRAQCSSCQESYKSVTTRLLPRWRRDSLHAGAAWRRCYERTAAVVAAHGTRPWDFDPAVVHSYMNAFMQRCTDLAVVCEARLQFGTVTPLPVVGGSRGCEVDKGFAEVRAAFAMLMERLCGVRYDVLDIKAIQ